MKFTLNYIKPYGTPETFIICDDPLTKDGLGAMKAMKEELIRVGLQAEQVYPHFVYRYPRIE